MECPCKNCISFVMCKSKYVKPTIDKKRIFLRYTNMYSDCPLLYDYINEKKITTENRKKIVYELFGIDWSKIKFGTVTFDSCFLDKLEKLPCKDCICFPICREKVKGHIFRLSELFDCILVLKYLYQDKATINEYNLRYQEIENIFWKDCENDK